MKYNYYDLCCFSENNKRAYLHATTEPQKSHIYNFLAELVQQIWAIWWLSCTAILALSWSVRRCWSRPQPDHGRSPRRCADSRTEPILRIDWVGAPSGLRGHGPLPAACATTTPGLVSGASALTRICWARAADGLMVAPSCASWNFGFWAFLMVLMTFDHVQNKKLWYTIKFYSVSLTQPLTGNYDIFWLCW